MQSQVERWSDLTTGLRVLVVDDDLLSLKVVGQLLKFCGFTATCARGSTQALNFLRKKKSDFDLVLSDVFMPDVDGFKLLQIIGLELDLPVIMMSTSATTDVVLKGVTHGAVDFLIKPVRLEELRNIWQHVVRRKKDLVREGDSEEQKRSEADSQEHDGEENTSSKKRKAGSDTKGAVQKSEEGQQKRPRVTWSAEMHEQFVNAVKQLGIDKAVPKKILEMMEVSGLTRENVASHLQKYRMYLKRMDDMPKRKLQQPDISIPAPDAAPTPEACLPPDNAQPSPGVLPISCVLPPRVPLMTAPNQMGNILPPPALSGMGLATMLQSSGLGPFGLGLGMSNMPGANPCMVPFMHQQQLAQQLQNFYPEGLPYIFPDIPALQMKSQYQQLHHNGCVPSADSSQQGGSLYHPHAAAAAATREECPTGLPLQSDTNSDVREAIPLSDAQHDHMSLQDQSGRLLLDQPHLDMGHTRLNHPSQMFELRHCAGAGLPQISSMNSVNSVTDGNVHVGIPQVVQPEVKPEEQRLPHNLGEQGFNFDAFPAMCGSRLQAEEKKESMVEFLDEILKANSTNEAALH